jgi:hypothetical protein
VSSASAAGPPDPIGFLEAARADPIGLVSWKPGTEAERVIASGFWKGITMGLPK